MFVNQKNQNKQKKQKPNKFAVRKSVLKPVDEIDWESKEDEESKKSVSISMSSQDEQDVKFNKKMKTMTQAK